jgi:hypothetical protein
VLIFALSSQAPPPSQLFTGSGRKSNTFATTSSSYEYELQASGGSGSYYWQSRNTTIASVNAQGVVKTTATRVGHTSILVSDTRNIDIQSKSLVYVLEPVDLGLQACPVETQAGSKLYVNVQMNAELTNPEMLAWSSSQERVMPINDCSRLHFTVNIQDESVFRLVGVQSPQVMAGIAKV